ncbi:hypothetical protein PIB30_027607 [Stylosanthes scabra]|uniref:Uncharacterized protein n=1 Tax=Stylosanthes scabra TaxID=79078 RepID=A0ABU6Y805_9FABA|nr:hypothetical protein [Stylosanthes scabra]
MAKVTGSSPSFKIHRGSAESTQKGRTDGKWRHLLRDREVREVRGLRLEGTISTTSLSSIRFTMFDSTRIVRMIFPIESLLAIRHRDPLKRRDPSPQRSGPSRSASPTPQYLPLGPIIKLASPSSPLKKDSPTHGQQARLEGDQLGMCEGDDVETKGVDDEADEKDEGANEIKGGGRREEDVDEEEDPEEDPSDMHVVHHAMDVDADEDYLQYLEELHHHPEYSFAHSSQAFAWNPSDEVQSPPCNARSQPSFDLSGFWPPPVGPSQSSASLVVTQREA